MALQTLAPKLKPDAIALFWKPSLGLDHSLPNDPTIIMYSGQKKRKTMDVFFENPNSSFLIFKRSKRHGWDMYGLGSVRRLVFARVPASIGIELRAPVWEMNVTSVNVCVQERIDNVRDCSGGTGLHGKYVSKNTLFANLNIKPLGKNTDTGIIPIIFIDNTSNL
jgi:hypothetical protein